MDLLLFSMHPYEHNSYKDVTLPIGGNGYGYLTFLWRDVMDGDSRGTQEWAIWWFFVNLRD